MPPTYELLSPALGEKIPLQQFAESSGGHRISLTRPRPASPSGTSPRATGGVRFPRRVTNPGQEGGPDMCRGTPPGRLAIVRLFRRVFLLLEGLA